MNSMERVTLALQHKEADHVPVYPLINSVSRKALGISYEEWTKDVNKCAEAIIKATEEIGCDCISTLVDLSVEAADWARSSNTARMSPRTPITRTVSSRPRMTTRRSRSSTRARPRA